MNTTALIYLQCNQPQHLCTIYIQKFRPDKVGTKNNTKYDFPMQTSHTRSFEAVYEPFTDPEA